MNYAAELEAFALWVAGFEGRDEAQREVTWGELCDRAQRALASRLPTDSSQP